MIETLVLEARRFLQPLREVLLSDDQESLQRYVTSFVWWPEGLMAERLLSDSRRIIREIEGILDGEDFNLNLDAYVSLFGRLQDLIKQVHSLRTEAFSDVGRKLFFELLFSYFRNYHPALFSFLQTIQIFSLDKDDKEPKWQNISNLFKPSRLMANFWNEANQVFNSETFLIHLQNLATGLNVSSSLTNIPYSLAHHFQGVSDDIIFNHWRKFKALRIPFLEMPTDEGLIEAGLWVVPIPSRQISSAFLIKGIAVIPFINGTESLDFFVTNNLNFQFNVEGEISQGFALTFFPPNLIDFIANLYGEPGSSIEAPHLGFNLQLTHEKEKEKILLLGDKDSTRLEYQKLVGTLGLKKDGGSLDFGIGVSLSEASLVLQGSEGDGFIAEILPKRPIPLDFDLALGWSLSKGFYIQGGVGFEYTFQINQALGPVLITTLNLKLHLDEENIELHTALSANVEVGPLQGTIQEIGLKTKIDFNKPGVLGNADLTLGFKPPSGLGLSIDAQGLKGGGFLYIEPPIYFGVLNVAYQNTFDLTIIGLISTELPGGLPGFSMVLSILAQFQPIQLGFGFALAGVGGLIAIHRKMNEEGLREVYKAGSLDTILFPSSPIKDSTRILSAIQTVFPIEKNRHTFGLMALITWGSSIVKGKLGILIEVGGPGRIALIGQINAVLPNEKNALVVLNMDILGFIDFGKQVIAIDAQLYNSKILIFSLSGEMALRLNYSESNPDFALAVGGFYPSFTPTIEFPTLKRGRVQLDNDFADIYLECYFAITSNTVQTGSKLCLRADWSGIHIQGQSGFDALIQFSPFSFKTLFYMWIEVEASGVSISSLRIQLTLTGPNPFHGFGYAEISFFFFDVSVDFDATFGRRDQEAPTEVYPYQLLIAEARNAHNLRFTLPDWSTSDIVFKKKDESEKYLDPLGTLIFSQKATPLQLEMERFANAVPPESERYLDVFLEGSLPDESAEAIKAKFSPAQFYNWTDHEKLMAPPFELFVSGKGFKSSFAMGDDVVSAITDFETIVWDQVGPKDKSNKGTFASLNKDSLALQGTGRLFKPGRPKASPQHKNYVAVSESQFTVTNGRSYNGKFVRASDARTTTYTEALHQAKKSGMKDVVVRNKGFTTDERSIARSTPRDTPIEDLAIV